MSLGRCPPGPAATGQNWADFPARRQSSCPLVAGGITTGYDSYPRVAHPAANSTDSS